MKKIFNMIIEPIALIYVFNHQLLSKTTLWVLWMKRCYRVIGITINNNNNQFRLGYCRVLACCKCKWKRLITYIGINLVDLRIEDTWHICWHQTFLNFSFLNGKLQSSIHFSNVDCVLATTRDMSPIKSIIFGSSTWTIFNY